MNDIELLICPICGEQKKLASGLIVVEGSFDSMTELMDHIYDQHFDRTVNPEWPTCFCGTHVSRHVLARHFHESLELPKQVTVIWPHQIAAHYMDHLMGVGRRAETGGDCFIGMTEGR